MVICNCCWNNVDKLREYDGEYMCAECYERTVGTIEDFSRIVLNENENAWRGTYQLESGRKLRCHDCYQFNESEWDAKDKVIGSVYYEIDGIDRTEDIDGGEYGYNAQDTFEDFIVFVQVAHFDTIVCKISDDD